MLFYQRIYFGWWKSANLAQCYAVINITCNSWVIPEDPGAWDCPENPCQIKYFNSYSTTQYVQDVNRGKLSTQQSFF